MANYSKLTINKELKSKIKNECIDELLRVKPELKDTFISEHKIISEMVDYFLRR